MLNNLFLTDQDTADNILTLKSKLEQKVDHFNGDAVTEYIAELVSLQALASNVLASAEKHSRANPKSAEYKGMLVYSERICRSFSHAIDAYRSILSKLKEEEKNTKGGYI